MQTLEKSWANGTGANDALDADSDNAGRIGRSIAYMVEHLNQPLQVSTLAAQASVSTSHFFALFKRQMGTAPIDFFIRLRMNHARELLDSTRSSIKEIAAAMGYDDPFYFSRVFKSVHQVAPAEYRRRNAPATPPIQPESGRSIRSLAFDAPPNFTKQPRLTF
ncbi:MAG TPA: AraC family transcriptional regulator [Alphaproteobacteria bacterium]|nr:AraC family transcriptional regulator [Alphaproteobacteria bacterium]